MTDTASNKWVVCNAGFLLFWQIHLLLAHLNEIMTNSLKLQHVVLSYAVLWVRLRPAAAAATTAAADVKQWRYKHQIRCCSQDAQCESSVPILVCIIFNEVIIFVPVDKEGTSASTCKQVQCLPSLVFQSAELFAWLHRDVLNAQLYLV